MNIWDTDVDMLVKSTNVDGTVPLNLGSSVIRTASDYILNKSLVVEARIAHEGLYTKWIAVEVTVRRRPPVRDPGYRLSGSWWRETLYVASFPDSQRKLHACDNYWEFLKMVPEVDPADVIPVSLPPTGANRPGAPPSNVFDCYI